MKARKQSEGNSMAGEKRGLNIRQLRGSVWVLLGFMLWIGFFIGAVIMHAMTK